MNGTLDLVEDHDRHSPSLRIVNGQTPERFPTRPMGDLPVLARLVLEDGTELWQVAKANRWTDTHVLVTWQSDPRNPYSSQLCWLSADDIARSLSGDTELLGPLWEQMRGKARVGSSDD